VQVELAIQLLHVLETLAERGVAEDALGGALGLLGRPTCWRGS